MMYCAECGSLMTKRNDGAWNSCCKNLGYWYTSAPLHSDGWMPIYSYKKYYFYPTVKWNNNVKPVPPKEIR